MPIPRLGQLFSPALFVFMCLCVFTGAGLASDRIQAVFVETAPKIDGMVQESVWQQSATVTDFWQREPDTGEPATEKTVVHICYDSDNLYFGFVCYQ